MEIIERCGPGVVAVFSQGKDNTLNSGSGSVIHRDGYIEIPETGVWSLAVGSDDGSHLYLNGQLLADNDRPHPLQFTSGRGRYKNGLHPVRIEYFEATGGEDLQVILSRDGTHVNQEPKYFFDAEKDQ